MNGLLMSTSLAGFFHQAFIQFSSLFQSFAKLNAPNFSVFFFLSLALCADDDDDGH
jgi:hypothetical protein